MMEVRNVTDAEVKARKLIKEKHPKLGRILFKRVDKKDNFWLIEVNV